MKREAINKAPETRPESGLTTVSLLFVWGIFVAVLAVMKPLVDPARVATILKAGQYTPSAGVFFANWAASILGLATALAMVFACYLCGQSLMKLSGFKGGKPGFRDFAAVPLGYGFICMVFLGLLYVKLWFPAVLFISFAAVPAVFCGSKTTRPHLPARNPLLGAFGSPLVLASALLWIPWILVPETNGDTWINEFAAPERWLILHGLSLELAEGSVHLPLPVELLYSIPLALGLPQAAKWLPGAVFFCGLGAMLSFQDRRSAVWSLVITATAAATCNYATVKNDGFAAGFGVLSFGFAMQSMGPPSARSAGLFLSGISAGLAMSAKYTNILNPLWLLPAVIWVRGLGRPGWLAVWLAAFAAPLVPYSARSFLVSFDPFFPVLSANLPSLMPGWDARNAEAARTGYSADKPAWNWPFTWVTEISRQQPLMLWILPVWILSRDRVLRGALFVLLGQLVWYAFLPSTHTPRYASISFMVMFALSGMVVAERATKHILLRYCLYGLLSVAFFQRAVNCFTAIAWNGNPIPYLIGAVSGDGHIQRGLDTLHERNKYLQTHRLGGATLLVGDAREYQVPKPAYIATRFYTGATPIIWKMANESHDEYELDKKFRQLNIRRISYNPAKGINTARAHYMFVWEKRPLELYRRYFTRWFEIEFANAYVSAEQGIFHVYRKREKPLATEPKFIFCLPGTEELLAKAQGIATTGGSSAAALNECEIAFKRSPNIGLYMDVAGMLANSLGLSRRAYDLTRPSYEAGWIDRENAGNFAFSAMSMGKLGEALLALDRARRVYPEFSDSYDNYFCMASLVLADLVSGKSGEQAMKLVDSALADPPAGVRRKKTLIVFGLLHSEKSILYYRAGKRGLADRERNLAAPFTPGLPENRGKEFERIMRDALRDVRKLLYLPI